MRSYLEIIKELSQTVKSDVIPKDDRAKINALISQLLNLLLKYSD
jgi:hypothetical protein